MSFALVVLATCGLFLLLAAPFLMAATVIVYAGAIVVLFLFVIMLLGVDKQEAVDVEPLRGQRPAAVVLALVALPGGFASGADPDDGRAP